MSADLRKIASKATGARDKLAERRDELREKADSVYGKRKEYNPFLNADGTIFNKMINYQNVLDNPNVSQKAKEYITNATGLTPSNAAGTVSTGAADGLSGGSSGGSSGDSSGGAAVTSQGAEAYKPNTLSGGEYAGSVGKKIADTSGYSNNAAKGQCVWYVRGRAAQKTGKDPGAIGNANEMWYNAKPEAKLTATADNIKPNVIVSYKNGTSAAGGKYGHVIYIEGVDGDTVYYTEGGSGYYKNGTDGVVKTASRQGILDGVNSGGSHMGSGVIGFIDLSKY